MPIVYFLKQNLGNCHGISITSQRPFNLLPVHLDQLFLSLTPSEMDRMYSFERSINCWEAVIGANFTCNYFLSLVVLGREKFYLSKKKKRQKI